MSTKDARRRAARKAEKARDAAVFAEYGADVLGVDPPPEVAALIPTKET
jgi:hypothetical protein